MRKVLHSLVLGAALLPVSAMVGCDRTVEDKKTVDVKDDGSTVTKEKKITENPNTGTMTKTESKDVNH